MVGRVEFSDGCTCLHWEGLEWYGVHWCPDSSPMLPNDCVNMYQLIYVPIKTCVNSLQRKTAYHEVLYFGAS